MTFLAVCRRVAGQEVFPGLRARETRNPQERQESEESGRSGPPSMAESWCHSPGSIPSESQETPLFALLSLLPESQKRHFRTFVTFARNATILSRTQDGILGRDEASSLPWRGPALVNTSGTNQNIVTRDDSLCGWSRRGTSFPRVVQKRNVLPAGGQRQLYSHCGWSKTALFSPRVVQKRNNLPAGGPEEE